MSLLSDQTVIYIKPKKSPNCFVEFSDNDNKYDFEVIFDESLAEEHKFDEILAKCEQMCGHRLPEGTSLSVLS